MTDWLNESWAPPQTIHGDLKYAENSQWQNVHVCMHAFVWVCVCVCMCMRACVFVCVCMCLRAWAHVEQHREPRVKEKNSKRTLRLQMSYHSSCYSGTNRACASGHIPECKWKKKCFLSSVAVTPGKSPLDSTVLRVALAVLTIQPSAYPSPLKMARLR